MAQVTLYLDKETTTRMEEAAQSEGVSKSQWVARLIRERLNSSWPQHVRDLAGAWTDFPTIDEIREAQGRDAPREEL